MLIENLIVSSVKFGKALRGSFAEYKTGGKPFKNLLSDRARLNDIDIGNLVLSDNSKPNGYAFLVYRPRNATIVGLALSLKRFFAFNGMSSLERRSYVRL